MSAWEAARAVRGCAVSRGVVFSFFWSGVRGVWRRNCSQDRCAAEKQRAGVNERLGREERMGVGLERYRRRSRIDCSPSKLLCSRAMGSDEVLPAGCGSGGLGSLVRKTSQRRLTNGRLHRTHPCNLPDERIAGRFCLPSFSLLLIITTAPRLL